MKPGLKKMLTGGGLCALGVIGGPAAIISLLVLGHTEKTTFEIPGEASIAVTEAGTYNLWYAYRTTHEGRVYNHSKDLPDGTEIQVLDANLQKIPLAEGSGMTTSTGNRESVRIGYVEIDEPQLIHIRVYGGEEERIFEFKKNRTLTFVAIIPVIVMISMASVVAGFIFLLVGLVAMNSKPKATASSS